MDWALTAWIYLAFVVYTALLTWIIVRAHPADAQQAAGKLGITVPVFVLGVGLIWFATLPIIVAGVLKATFSPRR